MRVEKIWTILSQIRSNTCAVVKYGSVSSLRHQPLCHATQFSFDSRAVDSSFSPSHSQNLHHLNHQSSMNCGTTAENRVRGIQEVDEIES